MSYTTKTEEPKQFEESKFIAPGVQEVKITAIDAVEPDGKSPYLNLKFENTKGQTTEGKLYFSDAAKGISEKVLGGMKTATGTSDTEVSGATLAEFAKKLMKTIGNKTFRHRFNGEEIQGKMGEDGVQKKNWFKATIGRFSNNSESITVNPSKLKPLDKTNQYDWKTLPTADNVTTKAERVEPELPF